MPRSDRKSKSSLLQFLFGVSGTLLFGGYIGFHVGLHTGPKVADSHQATTSSKLASFFQSNKTINTANAVQATQFDNALLSEGIAKSALKTVEEERECDSAIEEEFKHFRDDIASLLGGDLIADGATTVELIQEISLRLQQLEDVSNQVSDLRQEFERNDEPAGRKNIAAKRINGKGSVAFGTKRLT